MSASIRIGPWWSSRSMGRRMPLQAKKPIQTTPLVGTCSTSTPQIRIAVSALLELARWCQARQEAFQGGDPCQASHDDLFPPARSEPKQDHSADAVLGATAGKQPK